MANGEKCNGKLVTQLPFPALSKKARLADTFQNFPTPIMSVGKTADSGIISIFTKDGVTVYNGQDVLITLKGKPILIGVCNDQGWYCIPLIQQRRQWKPRKTSKKARHALQQANRSVYDLPSIKNAIKWMHGVCGYPVKSTWLRAINAKNYVGWPVLTKKNVSK